VLHNLYNFRQPCFSDEFGLFGRVVVADVAVKNWDRWLTRPNRQVRENDSL
jgi:hypothetical protein